MNTEIINALSSLFLCEDMTEAEVIDLYGECKTKTYSSGEVMHSEKYHSHGIGVLLSGNARIVSGNGETVLRLLRTGDVFGVASVFAIKNGNRTTVIASGDCEILLIPEEAVKKILIIHPETAIRYIGFLCERIDFLNTRISSLTAGDAEAKAAGYILSLKYDCDGCAVIEDSFTDIARKLNMGRASLYRTIDRFVSNGYICRDKNKLTLLDRSGLEDIIYNKKAGNSR